MSSKNIYIYASNVLAVPGNVCFICQSLCHFCSHSGIFWRVGVRINAGKCYCSINFTIRCSGVASDQLVAVEIQLGQLMIEEFLLL